MTKRVWTLIHYAKPWTQNAQRNMHHMAAARLVSEWRNTFHMLAKSEKIPRVTGLTIDVWHHCATRRFPDPGACMPAVKAAIDGLVDAGVIADDTGEYVKSLNFKPPFYAGHDALELVIVAIKETPCTPTTHSAPPTGESSASTGTSPT